MACFVPTTLLCLLQTQGSMRRISHTIPPTIIAIIISGRRWRLKQDK
jgi:hypothetical protein